MMNSGTQRRKQEGREIRNQNQLSQEEAPARDVFHYHPHPTSTPALHPHQLNPAAHREGCRPRASVLSGLLQATRFLQEADQPHQGPTKITPQV